MRLSLSRIPTTPYYLPLLTIFFVLHGYQENYLFVTAADALKLAGWYLLATGIVWGISWLILRDEKRAAFAAFILLSLNFFFGAIQDGLNRIEALPFLSRFSFLLPAGILFIIVLFVLLKKKYRTIPPKWHRYLNLVLVVLIAIDFVLLASHWMRNTGRERNYPDQLSTCDACPKPDIYMIVADGYPGLEQLQATLDFDNRPFIDSLRKRGFQVIDSSHSNYNMTTVSIASLLDMNFIPGIRTSKETYKKDLEIAYGIMRKSQAVDFLERSGYAFYNYSIFDLEGKPSRAEPTFLPSRTSVITGQTFVKRLVTGVGFHLIDDLKLHFVSRWVRNTSLRNNRKLLKATLDETSRQRDKPRFIYAHLMMPHYPYYYDSSGKQRPTRELDDVFITNLDGFRGYLIHSNRVYLDLLSQIDAATGGKAIIILLSDHGLREYPREVDRKYHFMNLVAVKNPGGPDTAFYAGMSNVNLFRLLFNRQFKLEMPLLKDSTSYLLE
jgi:hypothetical protein